MTYAALRREIVDIARTIKNSRPAVPKMRPMNTSRERYEQRILRVQLFVQSHLHEELSLERLAAIAGYSTYHFHRVFRGIAGESADDYIRRLRMEAAAQSLRYRQRSVLEVALDSGYGSHEAFTRAFSRTFGITPSDYQSLEHPPAALKEQIMNAVAYTHASVKIQPLPPRRMAFIRVVGPYCHATIGPAFGRIFQWAKTHNAISVTTECIAVYHDDPSVTVPEKQRSDIGITVEDGFVPQGGVQVQQVAGGVYAVLRHQGHYDTLGDAYRWLYSVWLPESGREPAHAPPYELYVNDASKLPPCDWLTDICIPLLD